MGLRKFGCCASAFAQLPEKYGAAGIREKWDGKPSHMVRAGSPPRNLLRVNESR